MTEDWLIPAQVTPHHMNKWQVHARERLDLAAKHLQQRNVAIQAGGNLGIWPYLLVEEYDFEQVHAFEPDLDNLECLRANTEGLAGVTCYGAALGRAAGTAGWLKDARGRPGWHKVAPNGSGPQVVVLAIDDIPIRDRVDLLALDVEGYELEALMGGERTLFRDRPVVILEDLNRSKFRSFRRLGSTAYGHPPGAVQEWLGERGYREVETVKNDSIWVHN